MTGLLDELAITNLGVIDRARIEPTGGLVVVTGETGAGKTLLLGRDEIRTLCDQHKITLHAVDAEPR